MILMTAFALMVGVSAVYAMSPYRYEQCMANLAFFKEGSEAVKSCKVQLDVRSSDEVDFAARYEFENTSAGPLTVKVMQPLPYGSSGEIKVGGATKDCERRYTYSDDYYYRYTGIENEAAKISDEFHGNRLFSPELKVYKQAFRVTELEKPSADACFIYKQFSDMMFVLVGRNRYTVQGGEFRGYVPVYKNVELVVYEFGECHEPQIEFVTYSDNKIDGKLEPLPIEEMTFREFVASYNDTGINEVDYFNAVVDGLRSVDNYYDEYVFDLERDGFTEWKCFDISLAEGEKSSFEYCETLSPSESSEHGCSYQLNSYSNFPVDTMIEVSSSVGYENYETYGSKVDGKYILNKGERYFEVNTEPRDDENSDSLTVFALGFLGRIVAFPIAFAVAAVIMKSRKKTLAK